MGAPTGRGGGDANHRLGGSWLGTAQTICGWEPAGGRPCSDGLGRLTHTVHGRRGPGLPGTSVLTDSHEHTREELAMAAWPFLLSLWLGPRHGHVWRRLTARPPIRWARLPHGPPPWSLACTHASSCSPSNMELLPECTEGCLILRSAPQYPSPGGATATRQVHVRGQGGAAQALAVTNVLEHSSFCSCMNAAVGPVSSCAGKC